jgi:hypothetical protein
MPKEKNLLKIFRDTDTAMVMSEQNCILAIVGNNSEKVKTRRRKIIRKKAEKSLGCIGKAKG